MNIYGTDGVQKLTSPLSWRENTSFYHQTTTNFTKYYGPGTGLGMGIVNDGAPAASNVLYAYPFVFETPVTVASIAMFITTAGGGNLSFGVYDNISSDILYPRQRLITTDNQTASATGLKDIVVSPNVVLPAGMYWFASVFNVTGDAYRRYEAQAATGGQSWGNLGTANTTANTGIQIGWSVGYTYQSIPEYFPASNNAATPLGAQPIYAVAGATPIPVVLVRLT